MTTTKRKPQPKVTMEKKTIQLIESDLPDTYLISTADLIRDVKNRVKINNYEVRTLIKDITKLGQQFRPYVDTLVEGSKSFYQQLRTKSE